MFKLFILFQFTEYENLIVFLFENEIQGERGEKGDAGPIGLPVNYQILI